MEIIIATKNNHKLDEMLSILKDVKINFKSLKDYPNIAEIKEDGKTFEENAIKKAVETAAISRLWTLGDDSGLVVDALNGAPGIFSSRYANTTEERIERVLKEMKDVPNEKRSARFVCCAVLSDPNGKYIIEKGICEGRILYGQRGNCGFGYDPIFYIENAMKSMAELSMNEKNIISHRGLAFAKLKPYLICLSKYNPKDITELKNLMPKI